MAQDEYRALFDMIDQIRAPDDIASGIRMAVKDLIRNIEYRDTIIGLSPNGDRFAHLVSAIKDLREENADLFNADLFNWRGRVTESLGIPNDASAGRALDAIRTLHRALEFFAKHYDGPPENMLSVKDRELFAIPNDWKTLNELG